MGDGGDDVDVDDADDAVEDDDADADDDDGDEGDEENTFARRNSDISVLSSNWLPIGFRSAAS